MSWAPDYCTSAELKAYLGIKPETTVDDARVADAIPAASRAVDRHTNRQFGLVAAPEARYYVAKYNHRLCKWVVQIDDLMTDTGLVVAGDYTLYPRNAAVTGKPWTELRLDEAPDDPDEVEITAQWGWTSVPVPVKAATMLQASRLFKRKDAPFGIAGSPGEGSEMRLLAKVDPDVSVMLASFIRWWGAV